MKRWVPLLVAVATLAVALPQISFAQSGTAGIALQWGNCWGGAGASSSRNFACNINTGSDGVWTSFVAPGGMSALVGFSAVLDVQTNQATLPSWWSIGTGGCRIGTAVTMSASFAFADCADPWQGAASGGATTDLTGSQVGNDPARMRIRAVAGIAVASAIIPDSTLQYYCCVVNINHSRTTGLGSCAGCSNPACITLENILLSQLAGSGGDITFTTVSPSLPGSVNKVTYNTDAGAPACVFVPTKQQTWGQIKSLYR